MTSPIPNMGPTYPFGVRGSLWIAGYHTGQDYACPIGTAVVASKSGVVVGLGNQWGSSYGFHQVIIESTTLLGRTVQHGYMHMRKSTVEVGQRVVAGQKVGEVGAEGNATGPHLHYEERKAPFRYDNVVRRPRFPGLGPIASALFAAARKAPPNHAGGGAR